MNARLKWVIASWVITGLALAISGYYGAPAGMFISIPVVTTAWVFAIRGAIVAGLLALPFTTLCLSLGGFDALTAVSGDPFIAIGHTLAIFVGFLLAYSSLLRTRLEDETQLRVESQRAKVQAEMETQMLRADRLATVGTLAAGVAHEVNNPLTFVLGSLDLARDDLTRQVQVPTRAQWDQLRETLDESLGDARDGAERIRAIVAELKLFVRERDDMGPVQLVEVLDTSLKLSHHELGPKLEVLRHIELVPQVKGDAGKLAQIFVNLLINAAHAMPESREDGRIELSLQREGDMVVASIADNGAGMSDEVKAKIFEPFFTTKPVGIGTGLGLSVCASIVREHGGTLELETELGRGTTFRLRLPVWTGAMAKTARADPPVDLGQGLRILIVDDDVDTRQGLARLLSAHECMIVTRAEKALEHIAAHEVDLILSDLMMPRFTGMKLHTEIVARRSDLLPKLWFITGGPTTEEAKRFVHEHAPRVLAKPLDRATLAPALAAAQSLLEVQAAS